MNTTLAIQKQHFVRLIITIIVYAGLGALFLYGAIHKFKDVDGYRNGFYLYCVFAGGLLIYTLYNLFLLITKAYLKSLSKDLSTYEITDFALDSDFTDANQFYQVLYGKRFFLYTGKNPFVVPYDRIIWAFVKTKWSRVTSNSPAAFANYFVYIYDDKKNLRKIKLLQGDFAQDILAELKVHAPNAFYGDSPEYYNRYSCFYEEMVEEVQKKNQF